MLMLASGEIGKFVVMPAQAGIQWGAWCAGLPRLVFVQGFLPGGKRAVDIGYFILTI